MTTRDKISRAIFDDDALPSASAIVDRVMAALGEPVARRIEARDPETSAVRGTWLFNDRLGYTEERAREHAARYYPGATVVLAEAFEVRS